MFFGGASCLAKGKRVTPGIPTEKRREFGREYSALRRVKKKHGRIIV